MMNWLFKNVILFPNCLFRFMGRTSTALALGQPPHLVEPCLHKYDFSSY